MANWKYFNYINYISLSDIEKENNVYKGSYKNKLNKFSDEKCLFVKKIIKRNGTRVIYDLYILKKQNTMRYIPGLLTSSSIRKDMCKNCDTLFIVVDSKQKYCKKCINEKIECKCGCKKLVLKIGSGYARGCKIRGKIYKEIYGLKNVQCGYQKGENNIAKKLEIRKKISEGLINSYKKNPELKKIKIQSRIKNGNLKIDFGRKLYPNNINELYRSSLEVKFSELLINNNISYQYEPKLKLIDNSMKIIDFVVNDIIIEISGFAYERWQKSFIDKMFLLRQSCSNQILILSYLDRFILHTIDYKSIYSCIIDQDMYCCPIEDDELILKKLNFCNKINKLNKNIFISGYVNFNKGVNYIYDNQEKVYLGDESYSKERYFRAM